MKKSRTINATDFMQHPYWFRALNATWGTSRRILHASPLDKDSLIRAARKETHLQDLGRDFWDEPLDRLLTSLNQEARLHPVGTFIWRKRITNLLSTRLRAEYWFKKHPGILDQEIYPPLLIVGLQRTGTTKLHRLLSADPDNRVLRSWEAINPAPFPGAKRSRDKRIRIARTSERALRLMAPGFFAIHPVEYTAPEEDILLLDVSFLSTTPEATAHVPSYAAWLEGTDQSPAYAYGGKLLRLLQWQMPGKRWVLKSPHHLEFLPLVKAHYGRPHILWTHRNLAECIPSFISMVCHSRAIFSSEVRMTDVASHWLRKTAFMLDRAMTFRRQESHQDLFTDIRYEQLVADSMKQLYHVYERHGGIRDSRAALFRKAEEKNPKGKYGTHEYSYLDFSLSMDDLSERNLEYLELFAGLTRDRQYTPQYHVGT